MRRHLSWATLLTLQLTGCAIEGPALQDDDGSASLEDGPGAVVGDPVDVPAAGDDPEETEPGPEASPPPDDADPEPAPPPEGTPNTVSQVCYPGADESYTTCLPLVTQDGSFPSAYDYPVSSQLAYQAPLRFIDLDAVSPSTMLAPNFALSELMQANKGRYGVFQPHVVSKLQTMRDQTGGALLIHSAYRSPGYNAGINGSATFSRHMYGDGIDMHSAVVSLSSMKSLCNSLGADYVSVYATHVHCDWRYEGNDPAFYGASPMMGEAMSGPSRNDAFIERDGSTWAAYADGFDEGEPYREWTAYDADGQLLETVAAARYLPPTEASVVEVMIGGRVTLRADVAQPDEAMRLPDGMVQIRLDSLTER